MIRSTHSLKKNTLFRSLAGLAFAAALSLPAVGQDNWPQWRGPLATGVAPQAEPPTEWGADKNIKWKAKIPGKGTGSPVIWGDKIFVQAAVPTAQRVTVNDGALGGAPVILAQDQPRRGPGGQGAPGGQQGGPGGRRGGGGGFGRGGAPTEPFQFAVYCLDRKTGNVLWQQVAKQEVPHEGHHQDHGYASYSPVTDGSVVVASFGSRGVHCFDLDGKLKWQKDLGRMQTKMSFGEGSSPALSGNTVVVLFDHEGEDFIVGLDKNTGNELWRTPREEDTTWSTPLIVEHEGKKQVITSATKKVRSYDLETGKLIWEHAGLTANTIPSPVYADGVVYAMAGFRGSALYAIKLGKTGDLTKTDAVLWSHAKSTPYVPSPLLHNGKLYFFASNNGILSVFDVKTGKPIIDAQRVDDLQNVYASPVAAKDKIYLVGRDGTTVVLKESDKVEVVAVNKLNERVDASPAIVGKEIFIRGHDHLYCIAQ